jgi:hypothetical protein
MSFVYHMGPKELLFEGKDELYTPAGYASEGFVHCCGSKEVLD